jgi:hypothetical protein
VSGPLTEAKVHARAVCVAAACLLLIASAAAQTPRTPAEAQGGQASAPQASPPAAEQPGLIDAFGHWIGSSVSNWNAGLKDAAGVATDAAKDAADAASTVTRDTAGAVARLPTSRVIEQRATCPTAPNGAPDCRSAAEAICKSHGFASGSSIDFQTAQKCPPIALNRPDGERAPCVIESYVTRALCQ